MPNVCGIREYCDCTSLITYFGKLSYSNRTQQSWTGGESMSDDTTKTLCAYVEEELQVKDPQSYMALIQPATHYCENCGRSAAKAENLCNPKELS